MVLVFSFGASELADAVDRTLASLPDRARRLRWTDAVALRIGPDVFMVVSGDAEFAREDRRRRRRGRESSVAIEIEGSTWDSSAAFAEGVCAVGVVSSCGRLANDARGVEGDDSRGACAPGVCGARRPEEKKEE